MISSNHPRDGDRARRILFIRNSRGITDITGAETYLINAMSGLIRAGHTVHLLSADIAAKGETAWHRALRGRALPHTIVDVPRTTSLADVRAAQVLCRSFRPDVIHALDHRADAVAVWTARRAGVPAVASFFGWTNWHRNSLRGRLYPAFDRLVMRRLSKIIVDSAHVGDLVGASDPSAPIVVIPNGVDLDRFDSAKVRGTWKTAWFGSEDVWVVGMIGRLHPNKGHGDVVDVAAALSREHPRVRFVVLGDAPTGYESYAADLRRAVARAGLEGRFLVTNVPSADIPSAIASFDVTLIPSHMESLSYVMLESMAMRKPVISTRVGGHGDLIRDAENGFLYAPGGDADLRRHLDALLCDAGLGRRIGDGGYETVRKGYSMDAMIARTAAVYDEVIQ
jgi:glycosyltransferase involved in cell wall biosynthesis